MLKYSNRDNTPIQLSEIIESDNLILFDFNYDFYDDTLKQQFEEKFGNYFYFRCIGMETIQRFKKELKTKLDIIAPYYKQLYETELECKNISFMLNKDLIETFSREVEGENKGNIKSTDETLNSANNTNNNKFYDTPRNKIEDLEKFLTNVTSDNNKSTVNGSNNSTADTLNSSKNIEKTELISRGNIGVTSSATLLSMWRDILINIDMLIIDECEELFYSLF